MGNYKKEQSRKARDGDDGMRNVRLKGENFYRDRKKVQKLSMYKEGKAVRNARGDIVSPVAPNHHLPFNLI